MSDVIQHRINLLNDAWRNGRFDELSRYFHADAVLVAPGFSQRVEGREAISSTYREFVANASVDEMILGDARIDVFGDTAVTSAPFTMTYTIGGETFTEAGQDLLVFTREGGEWLVVWRMLLSREVGGDA
ncbi:MAG TPA: nuclear transport factor 2 family protein [Thermoanaerobaculia bacterium]|nr:nuclear transport factor 2 family protein [Thermoanaerobaculia bacterium]